MKKTLVIQIDSPELQASSAMGWHLFADGTVQQSGVAPLAELAQTVSVNAEIGETLVLVPGECVLLSSVRIPSRQLRQIKQALPYMVEELIAEEIESVHLALPDVKPEQNAAMPVAVVQHYLLINWLDQLYQHGINPTWLCPDSLSIPYRLQSRNFFVSGDRIIFRSGWHAAQVFYKSQSAMILTLLHKQFAADELGVLPRYSVACGAGDAEYAGELQNAIAKEFNVEVDLTVYNESAAEIFATEALRERNSLINLLQGGYAVKRQGDDAQWLRTAKIAASVLIAYIGITAGSGLWYTTHAHALEQQTFALYHELFPQERRVVSPKKQMLAHLNGASAVAVSPLPLLNKTALGLRNNSLQLDELRYNHQHNDLQLQLRASSLDTLDKIKQQLSGVGLQVEITSASQNGQETLGRLHLSES